MAQNRFRYGAWRDGPDPLAPPYDVRGAVDEVGERVLAGDNLRDALRDLLRRGPRDGRGLDDLEARARRMRREALRRGNLDGAVTRAQQLLDQALAAERDELRGRDDDDSRFNEAVLDNLPRSTSQAVQELSDYNWASDEARATYQQILDGLRREVVEQRFAGMKDALQGRDPATDARVSEMVGDLNDLLAKHARGEDTDDAFQQFMSKHGEFFPENPENIDELVDSLARRAAAAERLMRSLSPQQREELSQLMDQALGDGPLRGQLGELTDNLRALRPELNWNRGERMRGNEDLGYGDATAALGELGELDDLLEQLGQEHPGATLDDVDVEAVERQLGRSAADDVRRLRELERELRRQGWVTRDDDGLTLSPKALRRLGRTALAQVFSDLSGKKRGTHDLRDAGAAGDLIGSSRRWQFGDEQPLDVVRTIGNAVRRRAGGGVGTLPVRLEPEDFEVAETERRASAVVALCVDLSYSMFADDRWGPMKQTALALSHLVATQFPQDSLQIIGFGKYAMTLSQGELAAIEPDMVQGTNLQHALKLAGRHLRRHPGAEPVVLVVTDGEPTAHLEDDGQAYFNWPTLPETVQLTVHEVDLLTRYGATLNVFMLGEDPGLRRFVDAVAKRSGGRVFSPDVSELGRYVVDDYVRSRRGKR
ncbi:vWA domain-containing protein [Actinoplanes friuliensis]|uniref:von Willebrand factor type A n=1 Tax=Actinoplanes friuliensis DSM 7358 TaxID=1246995 RepID=U5VZR5_9ACTN|nr:VWA domain-containing protein [Actinoplanes friuliensis]AGZ42483.1 von Willebrand factor type A [Actinoplanes friuliensis DSM 7358]